MSNHQSSQPPSATASCRSSASSTPVPAAPYPPIMIHPPSTTMTGVSKTVLRSSLSSSPHYSSQTPGPNNHRSNSEGIASHSAHSAIVLSSTETAKESTDTNTRRRSRSFEDRIKSPRGTGGAAGPHNGAIYRVQFCPTQQELYACINCRPPPQEEAEEERAKQQLETISSLSSGRPKKLGPILLELRRLDLVTDLSLRQQGHLFSSSTLAISRGNPQLGSSVASTCLSFHPAAAMSDNNDPSSVNSLTCATGLTTGALCVHTFQQNTAASTKDASFEWSSTVDYFSPRHHRLAAAVAWRPKDTQHVAIGLVGGGVGAAGGLSGPYRRAGGGASRTVGGGDREFCCLVWDILTQSQSALSVKGTTVAPVSKLSHNSGVASLAWLLEGQTLAVGGQLRTVQLYDLRVSGTSSPPVSIWAHTEAVNGIEVDPHHPHIFATFSKSVGEPVKLWDSRRMDSSLGEIKTSGFSQQQQESTATAHDMESTTAGSGSTVGKGGVSALRWSSLYPGTLSVAIGDTIRYYDTTVSGSRPVLTRINDAPGAVCDMSLNPTRWKVTVPSPTEMAGIVSKGKQLNASDMAVGTAPVYAPVSENQDLVAELYPNRMLVALTDGTVRDIPKFRVAPLALSRRDGRVVHALGRTVWIGSTTVGPSAMESSQFHQGEDISATMMRRARCLHVARYSMDAVANIQLLAEEQKAETEEIQPHVEELLRLWSWIERVESLCSGREEKTDAEEASPWPAKGLVDAGVWRLLHMDISDSDAYSQLDTVTFSDSLTCNTYDSPMRRAALTSCGWTGRSPLADIMADCESLGEFERSAALAVWHGDIGAGVEALQRGADAVLLHPNDTDEPDQQLASARYAETLQLVSMCIAGYSGGDPNSASSAVWRRACLSLLQREDLTGDFMKLTGVAYLRGVCTFLVYIGLDGGLDKVLYDEHLSLCDRVAFACRFLERSDLRAYLSTCLKKCQDSGYLEGLVVTGLDKEGMTIIQAYVDRSADVQTAALVSSRVILPVDWVSERKICSEWLDSYRDLLNTWQMWQSRAMFDVDRAELLRRLKGKQAEDMQGATGRSGSYQSGRRGHHVGRRPSKQNDAEAFLQSIPAQLDARCNYCSMSLSGLRRQEGIANSWLSKLKPVLTCCPSCRKPLPRCAICLLPMGCLNPYMELKRAGSRPARPGPGLQTADDLSSLANLPFAEWFTWCMRCKHGGHAHHLVGWFANHDVCPVSGCDCRCQFDGIQKLNRPALSKPPPSKDGAP